MAMIFSMSFGVVIRTGPNIFAKASSFKCSSHVNDGAFESRLEDGAGALP